MTAFLKAGGKLLLDGNSVTYTAHKDDIWNTAYVVEEVHEGKHE